MKNGVIAPLILNLGNGVTAQLHAPRTVHIREEAGWDPDSV